MNGSFFKRFGSDSVATRRLLIGAQVLSLLAYAMGLQFLRHTTGGTLFLFSTVAPMLVMIGAFSVIGVIIFKLRRRHSLFDFETYTPGQIIFREGDEGDSAYFIHSGEVEVIRQEDGDEKVIAKLAKGEYFGEMALLSNRPRNATVRAASNLRLAVLGKKNFLNMLSAMPSAEEDILKTMKDRTMKRAAR